MSAAADAHYQPTVTDSLLRKTPGLGGKQTMGDPVELPRDWDLGTISPERAKRTVFPPGKARCGVCGRRISDRDWRLFQTCDFWKCRAEQRRKQRELRARREEAYRRRREELAGRIRAFRDEVAVSLGIGEPERFVPVTVPAAERPIGRLPQERLSALGDHLGQLISDAREDREESARHRRDDPTPTAAAEGESMRVSILEQACTICRGYCCLWGEDLAYIDRGVMSSYLDEHPQYDPLAVISGFLSHVPENTCKDSCVYHGEKGCGLPREMRSSVCNGFECVELGWLKEDLRGLAPYRVFLVGMQGRRVVRYAFVDMGDIRRGVCRQPDEEWDRHVAVAIE